MVGHYVEMAIVLTVAIVSSSAWFLCACAFVPGANLALQT